MQIQLKQHEIESALKQYIAQQGINLVGKTVAIAFTAGRRETGLSAEMVIEDAVRGLVGTLAYPCLAEASGGTNVPPLAVAQSLPIAEVLVADADVEVLPEPVEVTEPEPAVAAKTSSLFG